MNPTPPIFPLPQAYISRMNAFLGEEAASYFQSLEEPYCRGIRLNPRKPLTPEALEMLEGIGEAIPWCANGYHLSLESRAGAHPLHEAGACYLQEPSAMIPVGILAPKPGERVLDLCAAPGGKSTQIADELAGDGLLVSNEPVPSRAKVLSGNLERMGVSNALVVSALPEKLAPLWPEIFDAILVDAPCSGEGMFRRHPESRSEWNESTPAGCAQRQKHILQSAGQMVRPGGRMVYSTCTFNPEENEQVIEDFLNHNPDWHTAAFAVPVGGGQTLKAPEGMAHFYPHQIQGEGHFAALLLRDGKDQAADSLFRPAQVAFKAPDAAALRAFENWAGEFPDAALPRANALFGETLIAAPLLPPLAGVKVLRAGVSLGVVKGKAFAPDHALALTLSPESGIPALSLTEEEAALWLHGEALPDPEEGHGWALVTLAGLPLGWCKRSDGWLKNHYPKGLRK